MRWGACVRFLKLWFTFGEPDKNCTSCVVSGPPSSLVRSFPETIIITDWDPYFSLLAWKQNKCVCTKFHKISLQTLPWKSHKRRRAVQKEICCSNKYRLSRQSIARRSDLVCGKGQRSLLRSFCKNTCPGFITEWIQNIVSVEIDFDRTLQRDWRTECISISSEPIILSLDQPSRDLIPTPTAYMYTDHIILSFNFYPYAYMTFTRRLSKPDSFNLKNITHEDFCRCLSSSSSSSSSTPSSLSS